MAENDGVWEMAEEHVEWLIRFLVPIIRRVGIEEFTHGYKHGKQDSENKAINKDYSPKSPMERKEATTE